MNDRKCSKGIIQIYAGTSKVFTASMDYNVMLEECTLGLCLMYVCVQYLLCTSKYNSLPPLPDITTYRDLLTVCLNLHVCNYAQRKYVAPYYHP